jgi:hypothetical protein
MNDRACTLGPAQLSRRLEELGALGADALRSAVLRFRATPEIRGRLERIVAAESECCAFLDFELTDEEGELVLRVTVPR